MKFKKQAEDGRFTMKNMTTKVAMEYVETLHQRSNDARYMSICEKVNEAKRALIKERDELESKCNAYDTYVSLCCERGGSYDAFYSFSDSLYDSMRNEMLKHVDDDEEYEDVYDSVRELSDCDVVAMYIELFEVDEAEVFKKLNSACDELRDAVVNEIEYMTDYDENETLHELRDALVEGCRMSYRDELARRYGWPLKIHARGYDAYLVGAQPLLEGGPAPIYRFPGGDSLVDECEMLPAEEASDE